MVKGSMSTKDTRAFSGFKNEGLGRGNEGRERILLYTLAKGEKKRKIDRFPEEGRKNQVCYREKWRMGVQGGVEKGEADLVGGWGGVWWWRRVGKKRKTQVLGVVRKRT